MTATQQRGAVAPSVSRTPPTQPASEQARTSSRRHFARLARLARLAQVVLGVIWLIDGALQFQPYMFGKTFITGVILPNAQGQPGVIADPITWIAHLIEPHVALFNGFAATLQVLIGLGLLYRRTVRPALLVLFAWVLGIWVTGEGLGGFFNDTANPLTGAPGAALLYLIVGLMAWPERMVTRFGMRGRQLGLLRVRGARMVFAVLWGGFAVLWLLPVNDSAGAIHDALGNVPTGAGWLTSLVGDAAAAAAGHGTIIALALAAVSGLIAFAVARDWHMRTFLWISIAVAAAFWMFGQGFGGVLTGQATDVNTGPLLILIAGLLLGASRVAREPRKRASRGEGRPAPDDRPRSAQRQATPPSKRPSTTRL
jgi:hypothetical protein